MRIDDIAALLDVEPSQLKADISDVGSAISRVYRKAKAETIFEFRKNEMQLARSGSPLAVQLVPQFLQDMNDSEIF